MCRIWPSASGSRKTRWNRQCNTLGVFGDRLGRLLFKLVVEHNMTNHLLGGDIDMTRDEYNKMRGSSVREVSATHGAISFKDVLLFHREE